MENKVLKFKNYFLYPLLNTLEIEPSKRVVVRAFQDWLIDQNLHGPASRARTRFIKLIMDRVKEVDEQRIVIAKEHSKNKDGKVIFIDKDGKKCDENTEGGHFDVKDMEKFYEEWNNYLNEEYLIDVTTANNEIINGVKAIVLNTNDEFSGREAIRYDEWCETFEEVHAKPKAEPKIEGLKKVDEEAPECVKDSIKEKK